MIKGRQAVCFRAEYEHSIFSIGARCIAAARFAGKKIERFLRFFQISSQVVDESDGYSFPVIESSPFEHAARCAKAKRRNENEIRTCDSTGANDIPCIL